MLTADEMCYPYFDEGVSTFNFELLDIKPVWHPNCAAKEQLMRSWWSARLVLRQGDRTYVRTYVRYVQYVEYVQEVLYNMYRTYKYVHYVQYVQYVEYVQLYVILGM